MLVMDYVWAVAIRRVENMERPASALKADKGF